MLPTLTRLDESTPAALRPVLQPLPPLTSAGTRLLEAASTLFYDRGVRAVGVDLIAESAGTTKKTLYDRFGSKDALVALYLLRRAHRWREHLLARLAEVDGPDQRVLLVFDVLETWMGTQRRGCAFVNAYAELGDGDHPAVPVVRAEKAWMRTLFDTLTGDPALGAHLHLLYEGTLVVLTAGANPLAAEEARGAVRVALGRGA
ncbi:helix-turn-helix domain-containing protein [Umezawaea sp.]|uniref:TetR/AcrR family transcriptional regulator n=1 Tax=Umezawaea sp. TaxID=1955258 RepID=UPI002ED23314